MLLPLEEVDVQVEALLARRALVLGQDGEEVREAGEEEEPGVAAEDDRVAVGELLKGPDSCPVGGLFQACESVAIAYCLWVSRVFRWEEPSNLPLSAMRAANRFILSSKSRL